MRATTQVWLLVGFILITAFGCSRHYEGPPPGQGSQMTSDSGQRMPPLSHGRDMGRQGYPPHSREMGSAQTPSMEAVIPEVRRLVQETVKEPDRAQQVEGLLQDLVKEVRKTNQETRGFHEQLNVLNADYDAPRDRFEQVVKELNQARVDSAARILDMRFKIRSLMTAQEWKDLNDKMIRLREQHEGYRS
jgi:hypothetical protein